MKHEESHIQRECVRWFRLQYPELRTLLFAVPNGGARGHVEAAIMKAEGTLAGVADLLLLYPSAGYHGLCIEMKTAKGRQSPAQKTFQEAVERVGYRYVVCRSFDEFYHATRDYLQPQRTYDPEGFYIANP